MSPWPSTTGAPRARPKNGQVGASRNSAEQQNPLLFPFHCSLFRDYFGLCFEISESLGAIRSFHTKILQKTELNKCRPTRPTAQFVQFRASQNSVCRSHKPESELADRSPVWALALSVAEARLAIIVSPDGAPPERPRMFLDNSIENATLSLHLRPQFGGNCRPKQ